MIEGLAWIYFIVIKIFILEIAFTLWILSSFLFLRILGYNYIMRSLQISPTETAGGVAMTG